MLQGGLSGLGGRGLRLFLRQGLGRLMSAGRLLLKLKPGRATQQGLLLGGRFLAGGTGRGGGLGLGPYKRQRPGLRSLCIRSFSIIGVLRL